MRGDNTIRRGNGRAVRMAGYLPGFCFFLSIGCSSEQSELAIPTEAPRHDVAISDTLDVRTEDAIAQTVYVPVYSHIYYRNASREFDLAATLSIRNTDLDRSITITAVRYHDSAGQLVRLYLNQPLLLPPLSSRAFVVEEEDRTGGVGASFIVEWHSEAKVSLPIVEAVMISTRGAQGISFVSRGYAIRPLGE